MILSSLALAAMTVLSPSTKAAPALGHMAHLHTHADTRMSLTITNNATMFRDVEVDGQTYTIRPNNSLRVTAPAGTRIYAASPSSTFHRGDLMLELTPEAPGKLSLR